MARAITYQDYYHDHRPGIIDAVISNDYNKVKQYLTNGANPNYTDEYSGISLLHYAAAYNAIEVIPLLIASGADPRMMTYTGKNAIDIAQANHQQAALSCLSEFQYE